MSQEKMKHEWYTAVPDLQEIVPRYMECMLCHKQVRWWKYKGVLNLDNPLKPGESGKYCNELLKEYPEK